jgi:threonyl-tRNA synthetase
MMSDQTAQATESWIPVGYDPQLYKIRHSCAHVMAQAVMERFPGTHIANGPPIESGFYYDFELPSAVSEKDLEWIEQRMRAILRGNFDFSVRECLVSEAENLFAEQPYKLETLHKLAEGQFDEYGNRITARSHPAITIYQHSSFVDLCRGPHVGNTSEIDPESVKVMQTAGAYWHGDSRNPMLTRIYGTAWHNKAELKDYLRRLEEAKKRDHRRLGKDLELFTVNEIVGAGLPLWLPKGATIRRLLEEYILERERQLGYQHVYTPDVAKVELYQRSGHWEHYHEDMFPVMELEHERMVLRPMNCPHHILIYQSKSHSYRDLPVRIAELGTMYRYERSGVLSGLSRVRCMTLNDAHIFCTPDQIRSEFAGVMNLVESTYKTLGITRHKYRLSLRDKANTEKYVANDEMWDLAERVLREAMDSLKLPYTEAPGEAAFYGPKLDIQLPDVMGHEETYSTIQIDFHLPNQFDLHYDGQDGHEHRPVMIHRAVISTMERMVAYLIEFYGGAFPVWLSPVQATVIPVSDRHVEYGRRVRERLMAASFRIELDSSEKWMKAKIREAELAKIPYMLVVGDREVESNSVAVRVRSGENLGAMPLDKFEELLREINATRSLSLMKQDTMTNTSK